MSPRTRKYWTMEPKSTHGYLLGDKVNSIFFLWPHHHHSVIWDSCSVSAVLIHQCFGDAVSTHVTAGYRVLEEMTAFCCYFLKSLRGIAWNRRKYVSFPCQKKSWARKNSEPCFLVMLHVTMNWIRNKLDSIHLAILDVLNVTFELEI